MALLLFALACAHSPAESPPAPATPPAATTAPPAATTAPPAATTAPPAATPPGGPVVFGEADANGNPTTLIPAGSGDPAALYAACRERVEGPEHEGECKVDADCAPVGCSGEVCAPKGTDLTTACDKQPCFDVLDHCGCASGKCTWSVKGGA